MRNSFLFLLMILLFSTFFMFTNCSKETEIPYYLTKYQTLFAESPRKAAQNWFQDAKFGMFIHWGVYSVIGDGEWVMHRREMTSEEYEKIPPQFNPTKFNAAEWVSLAKEAGMKYITITSKHHDGFAMWDSKISDWDIMDRTPYKKDILKMLSEECNKQGIALFFYHSHLDWHHPEYYPRGRTGQHSARPENGDFNKYLDYMDAQIAELASGNYGPLAGFWFDGWWDQRNREEGADPKDTFVDWRLEKTYKIIHSFLPHALIGNNHHVAPFPGEDFQMFERDLPGENQGGHSKDAVIGKLPLETCDTMNKSWGYRKKDQQFKTHKELIHYLVRAAGNNANLLLNVGPMSTGEIQTEFIDTLRAVGRWTKEFGETIFGSRGGPMPKQDWGVSTQKDQKIYIHILEPQNNTEFSIPGSSDISIKSAKFFNTDEQVKIEKSGDWKIILSEKLQNDIDSIIVLDVS